MTYLNAKGEPTEALKNVSFNIDKGDFISLVGPSGCGKSTMLRIICDLLKPTKGEVIIRNVAATLSEWCSKAQYCLIGGRSEKISACRWSCKR